MEQTEKKDFSTEFQFRGIEILSQSISLPQIPNLSINGFAFEIAVESKYDPNNKLVFVIISVNIYNDDKQIKFGSASISNIFHIANFESLVQTGSNGNLSPLPDDAILFLNSLSISTTRGVLFGLFKGTFLHNAILPILDPKQLVMNHTV